MKRLPTRRIKSSRLPEVIADVMPRLDPGFECLQELGLPIEPERVREPIGSGKSVVVQGLRHRVRDRGGRGVARHRYAVPQDEVVDGDGDLELPLGCGLGHVDSGVLVGHANAARLTPP